MNSKAAAELLNKKNYFFSATTRAEAGKVKIVIKVATSFNFNKIIFTLNLNSEALTGGLSVAAPTSLEHRRGLENYFTI